MDTKQIYKRNHPVILVHVFIPLWSIDIICGNSNWFLTARYKLIFIQTGVENGTCLTCPVTLAAVRSHKIFYLPLYCFTLNNKVSWFYHMFYSFLFLFFSQRTKIVLLVYLNKYPFSSETDMHLYILQSKMHLLLKRLLLLVIHAWANMRLVLSHLLLSSRYCLLRS